MIFEWILYFLFLLINTIIILPVLKDRKKFLQFPFLMSATWLGYFGILFFSSILNPEKLPARIWDTGGGCIALIIAVLSVLSGFWGYSLYRPESDIKTEKSVREYDLRKIRQIGILFLFISYLGILGIVSCCGGFSSYFSGSGTEMEWTGIITIYAFMQSYFLPSCSILWLTALYLRKHYFHTFILTGIPILLFLWQGRREVTCTFCLSVLLILFFTRKIMLSARFYIIAGVVVLFAIHIFFPLMRENIQRGDWDLVQNHDYQSSVVSAFDNYRISEADTAIMICGTAYDQSYYAYGSQLYNALVFAYVPAQIVGAETKEMLYIGRDLDIFAKCNSTFGVKPFTGSFFTGIGSVFFNFGFFGSLFFMLIGYIVRRLWERCITGSVFAQIVYITLLAKIQMSIMSGMHKLLVGAVGFSFIYLCIYLCAGKKYDDATLKEFEKK